MARIRAPEERIAYTVRYAGRAWPFRFRLVELKDGSWRAYILQQPDYGRRFTNPFATHRLLDREGQYICWTEPLTHDQLLAVVALWCKCTVLYICRGGSMNRIAAQLKQRSA